MAQIAGEHAAQAALEKKAQTYFEERPKIDEGLKTLLSIGTCSPDFFPGERWRGEYVCE